MKTRRTSKDNASRDPDGSSGDTETLPYQAIAELLLDLYLYDLRRKAARRGVPERRLDKPPRDHTIGTPRKHASHRVSHRQRASPA